MSTRQAIKYLYLIFIFFFVSCATPGGKDLRRTLQTNTLSGYVDFVKKYYRKYGSNENIDQAIVAFWKLYGPCMKKVHVAPVTEDVPPFDIPSFYSEISWCLNSSISPLSVARPEPGVWNLYTNPRFGDMERAYFNCRGVPWTEAIAPQVSHCLNTGSTGAEETAEDQADAVAYIVFYVGKQWLTSTPQLVNWKWSLSVVLSPVLYPEMILELVQLQSGEYSPPSSEGIISAIDWYNFTRTCQMLKNGAADKVSYQGIKIVKTK